VPALLSQPGQYPQLQSALNWPIPIATPVVSLFPSNSPSGSISIKLIATSFALSSLFGVPLLFVHGARLIDHDLSIMKTITIGLRFHSHSPHVRKQLAFPGGGGNNSHGIYSSGGVIHENL
jgi:hypothetical protein